jgi:multiple sugar transport system permease protein
VRDSRKVRVTRTIVLVLLSAFTVAPIYVMVSSSLKPLVDVQNQFTWIPTELTIQPYFDIWRTVPLASYFVNSLIVSTCATVLSVIIAIFAAFAVSRFRFRGRAIFKSAVLSTQMFPGILLLLPLFMIFIAIGRTTGLPLVGSHLGLIITYLTFCLPFSIWMLAGYFESIPTELDEAARVDGCTHLGALFRVILPTAVPGVVAVAIFTFMTAWGEVLFASVFSDEATRTIGIGLQQYSNQTDVYWNQIMAASIVVSAPVVLVFLLLQRYFVAGLAAGSVK